MSFGVSAEAGSATPGRLMPLCSPSGPPPTTVVVAVVPSDDSTRSSMRPSSSSSRSPGRTDLARPAKVVETRPGPPTKSPVAISSGRAGHEVDGLAVDQLAGADLRARQVLQDGDVPAGARSRRRGSG